MLYTVANTVDIGKPVDRVIDANGLEWNQTLEVDTDTGRIKYRKAEDDGYGNEVIEEVMTAAPITVTFRGEAPTQEELERVDMLERDRAYKNRFAAAYGASQINWSSPMVWLPPKGTPYTSGYDRAVENRVKMFAVTRADLKEMFHAFAKESLPEGAELVGIYWDHPSQTLQAIFRDDSFPEVPWGEKAPLGSLLSVQERDAEGNLILRRKK
jgi:hypothetical protein